MTYLWFSLYSPVECMLCIRILLLLLPLSLGLATAIWRMLWRWARINQISEETSRICFEARILRNTLSPSIRPMLRPIQWNCWISLILAHCTSGSTLHRRHGLRPRILDLFRHGTGALLGGWGTRSKRSSKAKPGPSRTVSNRHTATWCSITSRCRFDTVRGASWNAPRVPAKHR